MRCLFDRLHILIHPSWLATGFFLLVRNSFPAQIARLRSSILRTKSSSVQMQTSQLWLNLPRPPPVLSIPPDDMYPLLFQIPLVSSPLLPPCTPAHSRNVSLWLSESCCLWLYRSLSDTIYFLLYRIMVYRLYLNPVTGLMPSWMWPCSILSLVSAPVSTAPACPSLAPAEAYSGWFHNWPPGVWAFPVSRPF